MWNNFWILSTLWRPNSTRSCAKYKWVENEIIKTIAISFLEIYTWISIWQKKSYLKILTSSSPGLFLVLSKSFQFRGWPPKNYLMFRIAKNFFTLKMIETKVRWLLITKHRHHKPIISILFRSLTLGEYELVQLMNYSTLLSTLL